MFMNSPLGRSCAEGLATARIAGRIDAAAVRDAYRIAFGREATADESRLSTVPHRQADIYRRDGKSDAGDAAGSISARP